MLEKLPELKFIPKLLTHHNHHCLEKKNWKDFEGLNEMTEWGCEVLRKKHDRVYKIPHGIDLDRYKYIPELTNEKNVGYVGRVVPWKNLDKICMAAKNLNYKVKGVGYVDKEEYFNESCKPFIEDGTMDFIGGAGRFSMAPANVKDDQYTKMKVFVMYSTGEKESGTLPLLEAMARGVPVMATAQGMARDIIEHNKNGIIFTEETFESELKRIMEDNELLEKLRKNAWQTIKNYPEQRMAREYAKTYYDIMWHGSPVVSVIIPTFQRAKQLIDVIGSVEEDDYPAKEIIVVDDCSDDNGATKLACQKMKEQIKSPLLYLNTEKKDGYNLAMARNMGVIEALGSVILFLDDRLKLQNGALERISQVERGKWHFGQKIIKGKPSKKRTFIENFSWIRKKDFVDGGMFNERMIYYGGISQLTREQYQNKVDFVYDDKASVEEILRARGLGGKRKDIWRAKEIIRKLYA